MWAVMVELFWGKCEFWYVFYGCFSMVVFLLHKDITSTVVLIYLFAKFLGYFGSNGMDELMLAVMVELFWRKCEFWYVFYGCFSMYGCFVCTLVHFIWG